MRREAGNRGAGTPTGVPISQPSAARRGVRPPCAPATSQGGPFGWPHELDWPHLVQHHGGSNDDGQPRVTRQEGGAHCQAIGTTVDEQPGDGVGRVGGSRAGCVSWGEAGKWRQASEKGRGVARGWRGFTVTTELAGGWQGGQVLMERRESTRGPQPTGTPAPAACRAPLALPLQSGASAAALPTLPSCPGLPPAAGGAPEAAVLAPSPAPLPPPLAFSLCLSEPSSPLCAWLCVWL